MKQPLATFAGVALALVAGVLMPFGTFHLSAEEFQCFGRLELLAYSLAAAGPFAVAVAGGLSLLRRLVPRAFPWACAFVFVLAVMLYAQGNLIGIDYGILDGHPIDWADLRGKGLLNSGLWLLALVAGTASFAVLIRRRAEAAALAEFVFGCYVTVLSACWFSLSPAWESRPVRLDDENLMELSSDRNLVVFILDSYDRGLFDLLLDRHPDVRGELTGFTYYHNTRGLYSATADALPQLLTGHAFAKTNKDCAVHLQRCYADAPFLDLARREGFRVDVYTDPAFGPRASDSVRIGCFGNADAERQGLWSVENFGIYRSLLRVSWFKYLPHALKRRQWDYMMRVGFSGANADGEEADARTERLLGERLARADPFTLVPQRKVKVYHLRSVHWPNFNLEKALDSLNLVLRYRRAVAAAGLADRTAYVVMADHGVLNRSRPLLLCSNGGGSFDEDNRPVSYRHSGEIWGSALTRNGVIVPEATAEEMAATVPDLTLMRNNFLDDATTAFDGRRLELIRLAPSLDTVGDREDERIVWNGEPGFLVLPVASSLRGKPLNAAFAFASSAEAAAWSDHASVRFVGEDAPVRGALKGRVWTFPIPLSAINASGAFVRILLARWPAATPPPPVTAIAFQLGAPH